MKSLDTLLAEAVSKMKPATVRKYSERTSGKKLPQEGLLTIAESLVAEDGEARGSIRRNNGASSFVSESDAKTAELKESQLRSFRAFGLDEKTARAAAGIDEAAGGEQLTEGQKNDYEFCRLVGMSEADAIKVAKSNFVRG